MKKIETEILIESDIPTIWDIFTDFDNYPAWNPFIRSISGNNNIGSHLTVTIKTIDGSTMIFRPVLLNFEPGKELRWKGKLGIKRIFDGEHYFILEKLDHQSTRFLHGEIFSGILVPIMGNVLKKTKMGFQLMNEALKTECERKLL